MICLKGACDHWQKSANIEVWVRGNIKVLVNVQSNGDVKYPFKKNLLQNISVHLVNLRTKVDQITHGGGGVTGKGKDQIVKLF